jgi:2,5-furandicarboxylate decarboxylase 1
MAQDLRSFLSAAEAAGRVYRVTREVDLDRNLAALADESERVIRFENIKGYPKWTVVANLARDRDLEAIAFNAPRDGVVKAVARGYDRGPQPHKRVETGPVKEVIWRGEEANLLRLPVAVHSELDGGRYLGSAIGIVVDPETGLHNTTFPRVQVRDGKSCPFMIYSPHVGRIAGKYARRQEPMPMALVIGHHPAWELAAASSLHHPDCGELDYVGSLLGEDAEFVKCETIDVDVPAGAEIVIEGEAPPGVVEDEGPFGNYLGTYASSPLAKAGVQKAPVFRVKCITMRKDAIFRHLQSTVWTDHQRLCMLPIEASLYTALLEMGIDVHDVYMPSWGGCSFIALQMTTHYPGQARDALLKAVTGENTTIGFMHQIAVAVNRDVNIYDARDLIWAMSIRTNWARDSLILPDTRCSPLMPAAEKLPGMPFRLGSKMIIDATHLPPRDETEKWEYDRVWPMGKDTVRLRDFVENYAGGGIVQARIETPVRSSADGSPPVANTKAAAPAAPSVTSAASADHDQFVSVARLGDIPENAGLCVKIGKLQVALFKFEGQVYAINNVCPHQGGALVEGELEGNAIMCPLHGWMYDITNGEALSGEESVESYQVKLEGEDVKLRLPR